MATGKKLSATNGKTLTGDMPNALAALYPRVTKVSPPNKKTAIKRSANVLATFSEKMKAGTITKSTFKLMKDGTKTKISATVSYNSTTKTAKLNPSNKLAANTWYKATVVGGSTGVKNASHGDPMFQSRVWKFKTGS